MAEVDNIGPIWRKQLGDEPQEKKGDIELYTKKVALLLKLPPDILKCEHNASLTREELDTLLSPFNNENTYKTISLVTRFLFRGLSEGRKTLQWDVAIPALPFAIKHEKSRFTPAKFVELSRLRHLEDAFINSLRNPPSLSREEQLGRLLLSALLFGGLINR